MTSEDRVRAITEFGFTPRQARFLVLVLRHSGVCLPRQYATLAGIVHGEKTRAFFSKLVSRGYASTYACRHNRAKLYHVHHAALYGAIQEPNSGYRRPVPARQVAERLMLLDGIVADPTPNWLTSAAEKVAHFAAGDHPVPADALPRASSRRPPARGDGTFPDRLPIGIADDGRAVLLYSDDRFLRAAGAFARPRFLTLYERWLNHGERALEDASSTGLSDALAADHGRVDCLVLPHRYEHLSPVLASAPSSSRRAEKGAEKADEGGEVDAAPPRPSYAEAQTEAPGFSSSGLSSVDTPATL